MADGATLFEAFVELKASNKELIATLKGAERETKKRVDKMNNIFNKLSLGKGLALIGGFITIKRVMMGAFRQTLELEKAMAKFNTIAKLTTSQIVQMTETAKQAAIALGVSPGGFANAMYQAVSAGVAISESIRVTTVATQLAVAGFTNETATVDLLTTVMNAYGDAVGNVTEVSDILINTQNLGKTTIAELSMTMGAAIPIAASLGVNFETLSGIIATMTANGINTAETMTAIRALMVALSTPSEQQRKVWAEIGIQWGETRVKGNGLISVIEELGIKTGGSVQKLTELGINRRALTGLLSLSNSIEKLTKNVESNFEATGNLKEAYAIMADTTVIKLTKLEQAFDGVTSSWTDFLNSAENGIDVIGKLTKEFIQLSDEISAMSTRLDIAGLKWEILTTKAESFATKVLAMIGPGQGMVRVDDITDSVEAITKQAEARIKFLERIISRLDTEAVNRIAERDRARKGIVLGGDGGSAGRGGGGDGGDAIQAIKDFTSARDAESRKLEKIGEKESDQFRNLLQDREDAQKISLSKLAAARRSFRATRLQDDENALDRDLALEQIRFEATISNLTELDIANGIYDVLLSEHVEKQNQIFRESAKLAGDAITEAALNATGAIASVLASAAVQNGRFLTNLRTSFSRTLNIMAGEFAKKAAIFAIAKLIDPTGGIASGTFRMALGFQSGGFTGSGRNNDVAGLVHRNEFVIPAPAVQDIGLPLLNALKNIGAGGGTDNSVMNLNFNGGSTQGMTNKMELGSMLHEMHRDGELEFLRAR